MAARLLFTIGPQHVGKGALGWNQSDPIARQAAQAKGCIGQVLPCDIGKRVYLVDRRVQVENMEQRDKRIAMNK